VAQEGVDSSIAELIALEIGTIERALRAGSTSRRALDLPPTDHAQSGGKLAL
jgi:hypothetical protein